MNTLSNPALYEFHYRSERNPFDVVSASTKELCAELLQDEFPNDEVLLTVYGDEINHLVDGVLYDRYVQVESRDGQ